MNRRSFLKCLGTATVGTGIVYSFPSIIVPKNIEKAIVTVSDDPNFGFGFMSYADKINLVTRKEIYPKIIEDWYFKETPFVAYYKQLCLAEELSSKI